MISYAYRRAATEVLLILKNMDIKYIKKIPKRFLNFLKEQSLENYSPSYIAEKPLREQKLAPETEALLGIIYLKYWTNSEEKENFYKKIK